MVVAKEDIDKALDKFWGDVQESKLSGGEIIDPLDLYADAAMIVEMAKDANIPLEQLVASEEKRKRLLEYAECAVPYDSG